MCMKMLNINLGKYNLKCSYLWAPFFPNLSSVQFSCRSVVSDSSRPYELQHTRPPCPSLTPRVYVNSCPSTRWCHPAISSSAVPFSSCPQSLPASGSFPMSQLFAWGAKVLEFQLQHQLESRLPGEISITSDMQMTQPLWQKVKRN